MALYIALPARSRRMLIRRFGSPGLLLAPAAWVAMEYLRGILFGGFPWIPLGNAMVTLLPVAQLASVVGVYGLSLFVALVNAGFAVAAISTRPAHASSARSPRSLLIAAIVALGRAAARREHADADGTPIKVGLVQANIAQVDKWNPARAGMILERYLEMTRKAVAKGAEFVHLARVGHAVLLRRGPVGGARPQPGARRSACRCCSAPTRSSAATAEPHYNSAFMLDTAAPRPRSTARCTWCRSASTCRSSSCCSSSGRWSRRVGVFARARA